MQTDAFTKTGQALHNKMAAFRRVEHRPQQDVDGRTISNGSSERKRKRRIVDNNEEEVSNGRPGSSRNGNKRARPNVPKRLTCLRQRHASEQRALDTGQRYWPCTLLGSGSYGDVYQCWDALARTHVAVKEFVMHFGDELPQPTLREVAILKRCNHQNVMPVLDTLFDNDSRAQFGTRYGGGFVMPLCEGGDLGHWLTVRRKAFNKRHASLGRELANELVGTARFVPRRTQR